jgi:hypothetical protein
MFADDQPEESRKKIEQVMKELADHAFNKSHARHISLAHARDIGLKVTALEDDQELQERVLTVYHSYVLSASETGLVKIIENHNGVTFANVMQVVAQLVPQPSLPPGQEGAPAAPVPSGPTTPSAPRRPPARRRK